MLFSINSGLLEACVLALLSNEDSYGYKLTQDVKDVMSISESTLYPVLKRLQSAGPQEKGSRAYTATNGSLTRN